ncbi:MAG: TIM-barrel domain-containing protein [Puniceicoccaceae bacterium]
MKRDKGNSKGEHLRHVDARHRIEVEAWGDRAIRVRSVPRGEVSSGAGWALVEEAPAAAEVEIGEAGKILRTSGGFECRMGPKGRLSFGWAGEESTVLEGYESPLIYEHHHCAFKTVGGDLNRAVCRFKAREGERIYGLGQHHHGLFEQKGCVIDLEQKNSEITIPFMLSSEGYGLLWHNPAKGRVELGRTETAWHAHATREIDYVVIGGRTPAEIMQAYAALTGMPSEMPDWALGFWQSKLKYETTEELLCVLREYQKREVPLSVLVVDFFHWTKMGEWKFDPEAWPNLEEMMAEMEAAGVRVAVSIWPTVNPSGENSSEMRDRGLLVGTERGLPTLFLFADNDNKRIYLPYYDATNPEARGFIWEKVKENYLDNGVRTFWLDACEPDIKPADHDNLRFHAGQGEEVCNLYPREHCKGFYEGLKAAGEERPLSLIRSAWAGSQRYGAAVWSGDVPSTFQALREQIPAGLNMALSGIPWWTTDIGGFFGGRVGDMTFHELLVRWFQFGTFCPLMRIHGIRRKEDGSGSGPNEIWSYGDGLYSVMKAYIQLRERLRPYLQSLMAEASNEGLPPMRPFFLQYPDDPESLKIEDSYLLGSDLLAAPVGYEKARTRKLYLPFGNDWVDVWSGESLHGGQWIETASPLSRIPLFIRVGSTELDPSIFAAILDLPEEPDITL